VQVQVQEDTCEVQGIQTISHNGLVTIHFGHEGMANCYVASCHYLDDHNLLYLDL
jgi:hypothetical protein